MKSQEFETESGSVTLRRPSFEEMRKLGSDVRELIAKDTATELLYSETFDKLMKQIAATDDDYKRLMSEFDISDVWQVWQEYLEFSRLIPFFEEADNAQQQRTEQVMEAHIARERARYEFFRKQGVVPADSSFSDFMQAQAAQIQPAPGTPKPSESGGGSSKPSGSKGTSKKR